MESKNKGTIWHDWIKGCFPVAFDHIIIVYLPNKDCTGKEFDVEPWETNMLEIMGVLFRGATSYPSRGSYRKIDTTGDIETDVIIEETRMIVSFVSEDDFNEQNIKNVTDLLKKFGNGTNQESVAFVIDGEMYYINLKGARNE
jgi:hypothetical protein